VAVVARQANQIVPVSLFAALRRQKIDIVLILLGARPDRSRRALA